jgi:hypothetical protein
MPTQAIALQEPDRHPAAADLAISMKEALLVEDGRDKMMEVLVARLVEAGAARTTAGTAAVKAISHHRTPDRTEVVEEDTVEEEPVVGMHRNLDPTEEADTTHKVRAADILSQARAVGTISKLRVVHMVSQRRAIIPTDNRVAMILSLVPEGKTSGRHRFFSKYPVCLVVIATFQEWRVDMLSSAAIEQGSSTRTDGVHEG